MYHGGGCPRGGCSRGGMRKKDCRGIDGKHGPSRGACSWQWGVEMTWQKGIWWNMWGVDTCLGVCALLTRGFVVTSCQSLTSEEVRPPHTAVQPPYPPHQDLLSEELQSYWAVSMSICSAAGKTALLLSAWLIAPSPGPFWSPHFGDGHTLELCQGQLREAARTHRVGSNGAPENRGFSQGMVGAKLTAFIYFSFNLFIILVF